MYKTQPIHSCILAAVCAAGVVAGGSAVSAATSGFGFPITSVVPTGTRSVGVNNASIPKSGLNGFYIQIVLPAGYKSGTPVKIVVDLRKTSGVACSIKFTAPTVQLYRPGQEPLTSTHSVDAKNGLDTAAIPADGAIAAKVFELVPRAGATQRVGDVFSIQFRRQGDHADDTCSSAVSALGVEVRYKQK